MNRCVNVKHPEFIALHKSVGGNIVVLKSKIGVWQTKNNTDSFPSLEIVQQLMKPSKEAMENPIIDNNIKPFKNSVSIAQARHEIERLIGSNAAAFGLKVNPNLTTNTGKEAYGRLRDGIITLRGTNEDVDLRAARHESMHYILDYCLDPTEYQKVVKSAKTIVKSQRELDSVSEVEALEYLCDKFESYKNEDFLEGNSIITRVINFIKRLFNTLTKAEYNVNTLFQNVEQGMYTPDEVKIYNNNPSGLDRFSHGTNNAFKRDSKIKQLIDLYDGNTIEITYQKQNKAAFANKYSMIGKLFHPKENQKYWISQWYENMTNESIIKETGNLKVKYKGEELTLNEAYEKEILNEMLKNEDNVFIENVDAVFNRIFGMNTTETESTHADVMFAYNLMMEARGTEKVRTKNRGKYKKGDIYFTNKNTEPLKVFLSMLAPDMDVRSIIKGEGVRVDYDTSYGEGSDVTDSINVSFIDVISSIRYKKFSNAPFETRLTWNDFVTEMTFIAEAFRRTGHPAANINRAGSVSYLAKNKWFEVDSMQDKNRTVNNMSYEDIMAYIKIKTQKYNAPIMQAIYDTFKIEQSKTYTIDEEIWIGEDGNYAFVFDGKYGYGGLINRINEYLNESSNLHKEFRDKMGDNYSSAISLLQERKAYLQSNVINYLTNYVNSISQRDKLVFGTNGNVSHKILSEGARDVGGENSIVNMSLFSMMDGQTPDGMGEVALNLLNMYSFSLDSSFIEMSEIGVSEQAIYKDGKMVVDKNNNVFTFNEINTICDIINTFYNNRIDKQDIFKELKIDTANNDSFFKTREYIRLEKAAFDIMRIIHHNDIAFKAWDLDVSLKSIPNNVSEVFYRYGQKKKVNAIDTMRNADGSISGSLTTNSPFIKAFKHGTNKITETYVNDKSRDTPKIKAIKERFRDRFAIGNVFHLTEMKELGGLKNDLYGRNWDELTISDRLYSFFSILHGAKTTKFDFRFYPVLITHTRRNVYVATLYDNPFYKDFKVKIEEQTGVISNAVRKYVNYYEAIYQESQNRIKNVLSKEALEENKITLKLEEGRFIGEQGVVLHDPTVYNDGKYQGLSEEAKYIEYNLRQNVDYVIKDGQYMIGRAGSNHYFGHDVLNDYLVNIVNKKELTTDQDYVDFFKYVTASDYNLFEKLLKDNDFNYPRWMDGYRHGSENTKYDISIFHNKEKVNINTSLNEATQERESLYKARKKFIADNEKQKKIITEKTKLTYNDKSFTLKELDGEISKANKIYYQLKKEVGNDYMKAYFHTHILVNQGVSDFISGGTEFAKDTKEVEKRSSGYTSPKTFVAGNQPSEIIFSSKQRENITKDLPMIGTAQRYIVLQDIPGYNSLYGKSIDEELNTNGVVYIPYFAMLTLKNSAGSDLSYIGEGAIKTSNYNHDIENNNILYMKPSEMPISENLYKSHLGKEIYKGLLNHPVTIKEDDVLVEINPLHKFEEMLKRNTFKKANKAFLDYIYSTMTYDKEGNEMGVVWNRIGHKAMFQSAVKQGQYKVNHWTHEGEHKFSYNITADSIQEVSNDNYGLQTNKLQPTEVQEKKIMTQLPKLIGMFKHNATTKEKINNALALVLDAASERLNLEEFNKTNIKKSMFADLLYSYNSKLDEVLDKDLSLELVKKEGLNRITKLVNNALAPRTNGNIYVQHPSPTYNRNGVEQRLSPFRYYTIGENGVLEEITTKEVLKTAIEGDKSKIRIGMQEAIMAFPFKDEFGVTSGMSIDEAFAYAGNDFYALSTDYGLGKNGEMDLLSDKSDFLLKNITSSLKKQNYGYMNLTSFLLNNGVKESIAERIADSIFRKRTEILGVNEVSLGIFNFYVALNRACNLYAVRIPTTNTNMGFPTRIVQFDENIANTIITSPEKSLLDGSDYDIDELNVIFDSFGEETKNENGELDWEGKMEVFRKSFFSAIVSYYFNVDNYKEILSTIRTRNISEVVDLMYSDLEIGNLHSPSQAFLGYEESIQGEEAIARFVRAQTTVGDAVSIMNLVANDEVKNKYAIFSNENIKSWYLDVFGEYINAATDNKSLGNIIGKMGINTHNSNIISGLLMNINSPVVYNYMFDEYKKTVNIDNELELTESFNRTYGVNPIIDENGTIISVERNEELIDEASKYVFEAAFRIMHTKQVVDATKKVFNSRKIGVITKSQKIHNTIEAGKTDIENLVSDAAYLGEAIFTFSSFLVADFKSNEEDIHNYIQRIGFGLGVVEDVSGKKLIKSLPEAILKLLDESSLEKNTLEDGSLVEAKETTLNEEGVEAKETAVKVRKKKETINVSSNDSSVAKRYGEAKFTVAKMNELLPIRKIALESDLMIDKIRFILKAYNQHVDNFKSEKLIDSIKSRLFYFNNMSVMYDNDAKLLRKEVGNLIVGNLIAESKKTDTTVSFKEGDNTVSYDFKKTNYPLLILKFDKIIKDVRENVFDNKNLFLNSLRKENISNTPYFGIEGIKYMDESLIFTYKESYNDIFDVAIQYENKSIFNSLSEVEKEKAEKSYNFLKALDLINLLTQGLEGNAFDIFTISNLHFLGNIMKAMPNVEAKIDYEVEQMKEIFTPLYMHIISRIGKASPAIKTKTIMDVSTAYFYTRKNMFEEKSAEPFMAMSTRDGMKITPSTFIDNTSEKKNFYGTPFGDSYNMYGVELEKAKKKTKVEQSDEAKKLNLPLVEGEKTKTLKKISDSMMRKAIRKEDIVLKGKEVYFEMLGSEVDHTIQQGDIINIWGEPYKVAKIDKSGNNPLTVFEHKSTTAKERMKALDSRRDKAVNIASKGKIDAFLNHIQKVFPNIEIEYLNDEYADFAFVENGVIYFNTDKMSADMTIHEFAHVFTMIIQKVNPKLYNSVANEARLLIKDNAPIVRHVKALYGNLSEESLIYEIIGNTIQNSHGDKVEAILQKEDATDKERGAFASFVDTVKRFFGKVREILSKIFGGNWTNMETMTIHEMGDILLDAMETGKPLSYLSSSDIATVFYDKLNAVNVSTPIKTSADFIANLKEFSTKYEGKPANEVTDMIYKEMRGNRHIFIVGNTKYDFSKLNEETAKQEIKEKIVPKVTNNMEFERAGIVNGINYALTNKTKSGESVNVVSSILNNLGFSENNTHLFSQVSAERIESILRVDATKEYHLLDDIINNKDGILDGKLNNYKDAFKELESIVGYNPAIAIEYIGENEMVVSLYDFISTDHNYADRVIGVKNILYKYGIDEHTARKKGLTLKNEEFDIRSLLLTAITNKLQEHNIKVYNASVVKATRGNKSDAVLTKAVNIHDVRRNIKVMKNIPEFMGKIENKIIRDLFLAEDGRITTTKMPYMEMLASLYHYYYYTNDKVFDPNDTRYLYDKIIRDNFDKLAQGKLHIEDQMNLVAWRLKELSNVTESYKDEFYYNEMRLLRALEEQYRGSSRVIKTFTQRNMIDSLNKHYNIFDLDSEEIQYVHRLLAEASSKTIYEVRKNKKELEKTWVHFKEEYGGMKKFISNSYFMFENMMATQTIGDKEVNMGWIHWTTDEKLDPYAKQAQQKIRDGKITKTDVEHGAKIADMVEKIYIEMLKHEQWSKYGTEEVRITLKGRDKEGRYGFKYVKLTDEQWLERLYARGYKRGMIPIMPKTYIDSAEALFKRIGLEFNRESNEYQEGTPDLFDKDSGSKAVDDLSSIFLNQLSPVEIDMELQKDPNNVRILADNEYGALRRNAMLGLQFDNDKRTYSFVPGVGEKTNKNINMNLEQVITFFDLSITRKSIYEKTAIPQINSTLKLIEMGKMFSLSENNKDVADVIRNMCDMMITGSSYKIKNFGKNMFGTKSFGEVATTMSRGIQTSQMFLNLNVALLSGMVNINKSFVEAMVGDKFMGNHLGKAMATFWRNPNRYLNLGMNYHLIRMREADLYGAGMGGSKTNKSILTSFNSAFMSWITDAQTRVSILLNRMYTDGNFEAMTFNEDGTHTYDDTKDPRVFNSNGTQTEEQKGFHAALIEQHKIQGIDIRVDEKGNEHLTQPYDWHELNALKEYADKRIIGAMDKRVQTILTNYAIGRLVMPYFSWFPAAWKSMFGAKMEHESIFRYEFDKDTGELHKMLYQSEGMLRGLYMLASRTIKDKDLTYWRDGMTVEQRRNLTRRLATTLIVVGLIKTLFALFSYEEDDEDKNRYWGVLPRTRLLRNIDYAADGMFAFVYADVFQRLKTPSPILDAVMRMFKNPKEVITMLPGGSSANAITEIITGKTLKEEITEAMNEE